MSILSEYYEEEIVGPLQSEVKSLRKHLFTLLKAVDNLEIKPSGSKWGRPDYSDMISSDKLKNLHDTKEIIKGELEVTNV